MKCELWAGCVGSHGYGVVHRDGKTHLAHRLAYEKAFGPIPEGMHVDHVCSNRLCVRPDHLEAVTPAENVRRSFARGKHESRVSALRVTVCRRGHPITGYNEMHRPQGKRGCRVCYNAKNLRHYYKSKT